MAEDMRQALDERRDHIEQRARSLAAAAIDAKSPWVRRLGNPPIDRRDRERWDQAITTVAAYRDRYGIESASPFGGEPDTDAQRVDRSRAVGATHQVELRGRAVPPMAQGLGLRL